MNEIKAFIHRNRVADVIRALKRAGFDTLSVVDVHGMLQALDNKERQYSIELGDEIITEVKLELVCEDAQRTDEAIAIIRTEARTDQHESGRLYISEVKRALRL